MRLYFLLTVSSIFLFSQTLALETIIQGSIKGFDGEQIRLGHYQDYITFKKVFVATDEIENGQFQLKINLDDVKQLILMVEDKQTSLFAEAGQVYNISLSYSIENNAKRAFEKYLDLKFSFPKANELNQRIKQFNADYQEFFADNYEKFVVNEASKAIEAFVKKQKGNEVYQTPTFLKNYVRYALANLEDINKASTKNLEDEYLKGESVLIHHKEYMNFFRQLYAEDFESLLITKAAQPLLKAMMYEEDLKQSLALLKELKGFESQELTELYFINGLFDVYHKKTVNQKSNLSLLKSLSQEASTNDLRTLANSTRDQLELLAENKNAPDFNLKNTRGEEKSLADFRGKPIYLSFWANWSILSIKELRLMQELEKKYGEKVHFVSINIDEELTANQKVKEEFNFNWEFLYGGNDYLLREQYEVKTVPVYFLIDEKGRLVQRYAPAPHLVETQLKKLLEKDS